LSGERDPSPWRPEEKASVPRLPWRWLAAVLRETTSGGRGRKREDETTTTVEAKRAPSRGTLLLRARNWTWTGPVRYPTTMGRRSLGEFESPTFIFNRREYYFYVSAYLVDWWYKCDL
jgi:hypothetical protein